MSSTPTKKQKVCSSKLLWVVFGLIVLSIILCIVHCKEEKECSKCKEGIAYVQQPAKRVPTPTERFASAALKNMQQNPKGRPVYEQFNMMRTNPVTKERFSNEFTYPQVLRATTPQSAENPFFGSLSN